MFRLFVVSSLTSIDPRWKGRFFSFVLFGSVGGVWEIGKEGYFSSAN